MKKLLKRPENMSSPAEASAHGEKRRMVSHIQTFVRLQPVFSEKQHKHRESASPNGSGIQMDEVHRDCHIACARRSGMAVERFDEQ